MTNEQLMSLDKELATLLGYKDISKGNFYGDSSRWCGVCPEMNKRVYISRWTQDDGAAFRLAVENAIHISFTDWSVEASTYDGASGWLESENMFSDFPDKFSAVRVAIVLATINKLKGNV